MTYTERYAWLSLAAWGAVLFVLLTKFTAGFEILGQSFGLTIVEQSAARLMWTYLSLGLIAGAAEAVIQILLQAQSGKSKLETDERDRAIQARAHLVSYWFMAAALNVIIIHVLANAAFGGHVMPQIDLTSVTGIAFALLLVLILAEIVQRGALIWQYRTA